MLNTEKFLELLINNGYTHLCTVPCSFAKNLINASINYKLELEYVPCASEAVACSIASGLKMSGKMPIVLVQSSGLTNMGSCITSLLKPYEIKFPIIVSWRTYESGDSEIQHAHLANDLPKLIEAYGYKYEILDSERENIAIEQVVSCEDNFKLCILSKDTFSKVDLERQHQLNLAGYPKRSEYMKEINNFFADTETIIIGTTGNTSREMYHFMNKTKNFYMVGNMGGALSLGLGAYIAGKSVVVCGGDAEFVMHLGGLTSSGRYSSGLHGNCLTYIVFDNQMNKSTGGQNTYQKHLNYKEIAKSAGISMATSVSNLESFKSILTKNRNGITFIHVKVGIDKEVSRPPLSEIKNTSVFNQ
ncbi:thiamine pyrophosphate-dependent enzyme [Candidatus Pseudothioglobus singularis]|jgi:sulfopyruvate decarboxylase TPP-binding subunit|nr:thiamine pyrophosphate-dependent enzyme [Candidatus Pseudothioglobus singularis]